MVFFSFFFFQAPYEDEAGFGFSSRAGSYLFELVLTRTHVWYLNLQYIVQGACLSPQAVLL